MARKTNGGKIYATFTIDEDIKLQFNIACTTLGLNMSETVEAMMTNFIDISKESVQKANKSREKVSTVEVIDETLSTRLKEEQ
jgi:antitoxin component of RelBE/YafQ-DinJ toxin-antitoxin module